MSRVLIRVVKTIVVAIAYVDARYAVAIVAGVQVPKAGLRFVFAHCFRFIGAVATIVVAIAEPLAWYATIIGTLETIGGTFARCAQLWLFIGRGVVWPGETTIIIRVT